jgi:hypothetical protein
MVKSCVHAPSSQRFTGPCSTRRPFHLPPSPSPPTLQMASPWSQVNVFLPPNTAGPSHIPPPPTEEPKPTSEELKSAFTSVIAQRNGPDAPLMTKAMREREDARLGIKKREYNEVCPIPCTAYAANAKPSPPSLPLSRSGLESASQIGPLLKDSFQPALAFPLYTTLSELISHQSMLRHHSPSINHRQREICPRRAMSSWRTRRSKTWEWRRKPSSMCVGQMPQ